MRIVSVNVGIPREVTWEGRSVVTGFLKSPADRPLAVRRLNIDGDAQADLSVHGGPDKAVYAYPSEHYPGWESELGRTLPPGAFGENLTTEGLLEGAVHIGDVFRVGTATLVATQPRMPCFKLGIAFGNPLMVKSFLKKGLPGIYFAVQAEGIVEPGAPIERLHEDENRVSVAEMLRLVLTRAPEPEGLRRLLDVPALAAVWRRELEERLADGPSDRP